MLDDTYQLKDDLERRAKSKFGPYARVQTGWEGFPMAGEAFAEVVAPGGKCAYQKGNSIRDALEKLGYYYLRESDSAEPN